MTSAEDSVGIRPVQLSASGIARVKCLARDETQGSLTQACQGVLAIDVHGTATADTLTAASSESQSRVELVLDANNGIQDHRSSLVQVDGVALKTRLDGRGIGVPSVDLEGLQPGLRSRRRFTGIGVLNSGH